MPSKNRQRLESIYGHKYKRITTASIADKNFCFYCGEYMQCLDHQPPISLVDSISHDDGYFEYALIPSCEECNRLLGSKLTNTIQERFDLAKHLLKEKYAKMLKATATKRDYKYLGSKLKKQCKAYDDAGAIVRKRISFKGYPFSIDGSLDDKRVESTKKFIVDGVGFDDRYLAIKYACDINGFKYASVCSVVNVDKGSISGIIDEYKRCLLVSILSKKIHSIRKDRWPKMPKKIVDKKIESITMNTTVESLIDNIDQEYKTYLKNMSMK